MLEALITSKTRIKLLLKFFLNPSTSAHLRGLATEFNESSNAIRLELNRLEEAGMLTTVSEGNKKLFQVNKKHALFNSLQQIVRKYAGIDEIIDNILKGLGNLEKAYLTGDMAKGKSSNVVDLVLIGAINKSYLEETVEKAEKVLGKQIHCSVFDNSDPFVQMLDKKEYLLIYNKDK
jgi:predicted nucleotidyltransferase